MVGDVLAEICFLLTAAALLIAFFRPRRKGPFAEHVSQLMSGNGAR